MSLIDGEGQPVIPPEALRGESVLASAYAANSATTQLGWSTKSAAEILRDFNEVLAKVDFVQVPAPLGCYWDMDKLVVRKDSPWYPVVHQMWLDQRRELWSWYRSKDVKRRRRPLWTQWH